LVVLGNKIGCLVLVSTMTPKMRNLSSSLVAILFSMEAINYHAKTSETMVWKFHVSAAWQGVGKLVSNSVVQPS
jgi:hypothetical protein